MESNSPYYQDNEVILNYLLITHQLLSWYPQNVRFNQQYIKPTCEIVKLMIGNNINTASLSTYVSLLNGRERGRDMWLASSHTPTAFTYIQAL